MKKLTEGALEIRLPGSYSTIVQHSMPLQGLILGKQHRTRLNFGQGPPWLPGIIQESKGPVPYTVELEVGRVLCQHMDHLRADLVTAQPSVEMADYSTIKIPSQKPDLPPADPPPATAGQSLCISSWPHKSPGCYSVTVKH